MKTFSYIVILILGLALFACKNEPSTHSSSREGNPETRKEILLEQKEQLDQKLEVLEHQKEYLSGEFLAKLEQRQAKLEKQRAELIQTLKLLEEKPMGTNVRKDTIEDTNS